MAPNVFAVYVIEFDLKAGIAIIWLIFHGNEMGNTKQMKSSVWRTFEGLFVFTRPEAELFSILTGEIMPMYNNVDGWMD